METFNNLNSFFSKKLDELKCDELTKAYIVSIFGKFNGANADYSKDSITLIYAQAKLLQDFQTFNQIADWLFMCNTLYPESLNGASIDYYHTIGRLSYYSCYKLINKKWVIFEQLADNFVPLSTEARKIIRKY